MSSDKRIYLDYNAGAPLRPEAHAAMVRAMELGGNASSIHAEGRRARHQIESARRQLADVIGADPRNITFTSSGSEANASVLAPAVSEGGTLRTVDRLLVGATEHPSVRSGGRFASAQVSEIPVDSEGVVDRDALSEALAGSSERGETVLVSVMLANNETGTIQPVAELAKIAHASGAIVHCDAAQALGRIPVSLDMLGVDFLTLSSHKIGGPQGAGAIVMASESRAFMPLITGGGQERRRRAGTENTAAIAGFGAVAASIAGDLVRTESWRTWRDELAMSLAKRRDITIFSSGTERLPQTLCFGFSRIAAETLLIGLDLEGVAVSSGSACSSGKVGPSHVLAAMGVDAEPARNAIRISFGWATDENDLDKFQTALEKVLGRVVGKDDRAA